MQENINIPDSNITTNLTFRQLVLMNMQQLTNFPYIEKDFDALTDYELLCLVVKYLNDVIDNQNEQNDSITRLYESFLALQDYVNNTKDELEDAFNNLDDYVRNYFANLDVQDEINNKLDQMLEDGQLEQIIEQFLQLVSLICFDNVNGMVNSVNIINGSYAKTLGYYSKNDGGSALYKIRTITNDDVVDYATIIPIETYDTLIAELINEDNTIRPEQLGAYGDDSHDDTIKIQIALNKFKNIQLSKVYRISSQLTIQTNTHLYGNGTIKSNIDTSIFNEIVTCNIENLTFININSNTDEDGLVIGSFANTIKESSRIHNCYFTSFECFVVGEIKSTSVISNNRFLYLNKWFVNALIDSHVVDNYINASSLAAGRSIMVRSSINNTTFGNNFVDYWRHCFRLRAGNASAQIIGNTFDDCYTVFQDFVQSVTITGNTFSNIKYVPANWQTGVLPPEDIRSKKWSIFKFDGSTETTSGVSSVVIDNVTFTGNLARNCDSYIVAETSCSLYGHNDFRGNSMFDCENGSDFGYILGEASLNVRMTPPYFDFWEGKTFTELPNPRLYATSFANRVKTYHGMHCFVGNDEYINVNGTWKQYTYV